MRPDSIGRRITANNPSAIFVGRLQIGKSSNEPKGPDQTTELLLRPESISKLKYRERKTVKVKFSIQGIDQRRMSGKEFRKMPRSKTYFTIYEFSVGDADGLQKQPIPCLHLKWNHSEVPVDEPLAAEP